MLFHGLQESKLCLCLQAKPALQWLAGTALIIAGLLAIAEKP
jgi:hypothetical protein